MSLIRFNHNYTLPFQNNPGAFEEIPVFARLLLREDNVNVFADAHYNALAYSHLAVSSPFHLAAPSAMRGAANYISAIVDRFDLAAHL